MRFKWPTDIRSSSQLILIHLSNHLTLSSCLSSYPSRVQSTNCLASNQPITTEAYHGVRWFFEWRKYGYRVRSSTSRLHLSVLDLGHPDLLTNKPEPKWLMDFGQSFWNATFTDHPLILNPPNQQNPWRGLLPSCFTVDPNLPVPAV